MGTFEEIVGEDAAYDFATWIYNEITEFIKSIGLNYIPHRDLEADEGLSGWYKGIIEGSLDEKDDYDSVWLSDDDINDGDKFVVNIQKPLDGYKNSDRDSDNTHLKELADNLVKIATYGVEKMEHRVLERLKNNKIVILDRYRPIVETVKASLDNVEYYVYDSKISTYILTYIITFDFIDEEEYLIGGSKYKKAKKRFEKYY